MSISIALSAAANANAAAANAAAQRAKTIACQSLIKGYENDSATVEQARQYSECISRIYPDEMQAGDVLLLKAWIFCVFIGVLIGLWPIANHLSFSSSPDVGDRFMGAIVGFCFGAIAPLALYGAWLALKFVVTA